MGFLLSRKLITPLLLAVGLLSIVGGEIEGGLWIDALGLAYWLARGWWQRRHQRQQAATPRATFSAQVVANGARAGQSDGASGAFSRLDPAWRDWLRREVDSRPY